MGIVVNTNTQSLFAQRSLRNNTSMVQKSIENYLLDIESIEQVMTLLDFLISQKMTTLIRGMDQAKRNIGDGMAMISTIDGALATVQDNLQRIRELTVQAYNGTNSEDERAAIQREINERVQAIDDMGTQATFNGVNLLDGAQDITLQIGAEDGNTLVLKTASGATTDVGFEVNFSTSSNGSIAQDASITLSEFSVGSTGFASSKWFYCRYHKWSHRTRYHD